MFERAAIKKDSKSDLKIKYWRNVFIAVLAVLTVSGTINSLLTDLVKNESLINFNSWYYIKQIIRFYIPNFLTGDNYLYLSIDYVLNFVINLITNTVTFPFYVGYLIYNTGFSNGTQVFYVLFGIVFYLAILVFVFEPLHVGTMKYFLCREEDPTSSNNHIMFSFSTYYKNIVITKAYEALMYALWCFTIINIPIKHYEYYMVDYILCDNPSISPKEALKLSKKLTDGNKWNLFLFDLSFLGYTFLSLFTFGLLDYLFTNPYKEISKAKLYLKLKDQLLIADEDAKSTYQSIITKNREGLILRRNVEYDCPYKIVDFILIFFIVSMVGWLWEVSLHLIETGNFANRGTLYGPWLPIYGSGGVIVLFLLKKTRKNPIITFFLSITICLTIEYFTGWYLEATRGVKYWDYSDMPFNLHGRICLYGGLVFGLGCIMMIYFIGPFLYTILSKFKSKPKWIVAIILGVIFITDFIISSIYPNQGDGITSPVSLLLYIFNLVK